MSSRSRGEELMDAFLDIMLPLPHIDNYRSDEWLRNPQTGWSLELDRFYPTLAVGFEFQGDQHYRATDLDSGRTQANDRIKRQLCKQAGVKIIMVKAIDLQASRMANRIKPAVRHYTQMRPGKHIPPWLAGLPIHDPKRTKSLNEEGIEYRAYLRERFPATVTARMKSTAKRAMLEPWQDKR